jgi:hypothetical protein
MNPNNPAYAASQTNRGVQLNPNNPEYKGSAPKLSVEVKDSDRQRVLTGTLNT